LKIALLILTLLFITSCEQKKPVEEIKVKKPQTISVQEKKRRFRELLVPAVNEAYLELSNEYKKVSILIKTDEHNKKLENLRTKYKVQTNTELLTAIKPHPKSIALAQAALESAWGTSRFFKEANNVFGVWSFNKNEPRIAAGEKRGDKTIWLKKYISIKDSVKDYYLTLAKGRAFKEFRELKISTDNPYELVLKLDKYSEKGEEYANELTSVISYNKFNLYDEHQFERNSSF